MKKEQFINWEYGYGELTAYERYKLYNWVLTLIKPKNILEIGTGSGASSYYMASALKKLQNDGTIYTCDPDPRDSSRVVSAFSNIKYAQTISKHAIQSVILNNINLDYIFFDGPEDSELPLEDLKDLESYISPDCYFSGHDWEYVPRLFDGGIGEKSKLIRPYIENSKRWEPVEILSGLQINSDFYMTKENPCDSVGLCLYKFKG